MRTQFCLRTLLGCCLLARGIAAGAGNAADHRTPPELPKFSHPRDITNPLFPLASLKQDILKSKGKRIERTAKPEVRKTFKVGSQNVEAFAVEDRESEGGKLTEVTLDYFAQGDDGAVYYLGEDVDEYKNGEVTGHSGAWLLGKDTQTPGVLMPAHPQVGDKFRSEDVPNITTEEDEVASVSETVNTPAGTFKNCLKIKETLSDGAVEYKFYAPGVGCVKEAEADDQFLLQAHDARTARSSSQARAQSPPPQKAPIQDPMARLALGLVGDDPSAEAYWINAINDPGLPAEERKDLIEDLNEDGLSNPGHPGPEDLPLILNRLRLIEELAPSAMDQVNWDAFMEAYKDLVNLMNGRGAQ